MGLFHSVMKGNIKNLYGPMDDYWYRPYLDSQATSSGIWIDEFSVTKNTYANQCMRVRSESLAILPKKIHENKTMFGREAHPAAPNHPLYQMIYRRPNPQMTSYRFFALLSYHLDTFGNSYSYIERYARTGQPRGLWPICPHLVRIESEKETKTGKRQLWYHIRGDDGLEVKFYPDEILHVRGASYEGVKGFSQVNADRDFHGWVIATMNYGARFMKNSARMSGLLISDTVLRPEVKKDLKESFERFHTGTDNAGRFALIEGGLKYEQLTMPNNEAQWLDTLKHQRTTTCGLYRVPPFMIGDPEPVSDNNIEHLMIHFVQAAVQPTVTNCEQEFQRALMAEEELGRYFIKFNLDGFLRGDTAARTDKYVKMINAGVFSQNQVLELEDMEPYEEGNKHWIQLNMVPVEMAEELLSAQQEQAAQPQPAPAQKAAAALIEELQLRVQRSYRVVFEDAVGRVLLRKNGDRERFAPIAFQPILSALSECLGVELPEDFTGSYLAAMGKRAATWESKDVAEAELARMVDSILEKRI